MKKVLITLELLNEGLKCEKTGRSLEKAFVIVEIDGKRIEGKVSLKKFVKIVNSGAELFDYVKIITGIEIKSTDPDCSIGLDPYLTMYTAVHYDTSQKGNWRRKSAIKSGRIAGKIGAKARWGGRDPSTVRDRQVRLSVTQNELEMMDAKAAAAGTSRVELVVRAVKKYKP